MPADKKQKIKQKKKQINTHAKGKKKELLCQKMLEADGWTILFKSQFIRFGRIDFGEKTKDKENEKAKFDIVAVKNKTWRFVSVKSTKSSNKFKQENLKIRQFIMDNINSNTYNSVVFELWVWNAPSYRGRGANKTFFQGGFNIISISPYDTNTTDSHYL